ncbi:MAG: hypothetical protein JSW73_02945 [Candidatus Woesearchaeota archaeon]|nr:MAG: hypothetical protein JSW73_02945 [Candidatus Woesearchaeota archaeon]
MLENYVGILAIAATFFGVMMSIAYFPQTYKMFKRKSSADVSIISFSILLPGLLVWLMYGISLSNMPLIIANTIAIIGDVSVIITYFKYKVEK